MDDKIAYEFLCKTLSQRISNNYLGKVSELTKELKSENTSGVAKDILLAPDMFYAAALMQKSSIYYGAGDFRKCIELIETSSNPDFKDVANKLVLFKSGHLYHKSMQVDVNDANENEGIKLYKGETVEESKRTAVFTDKCFD